MPRALEIVLVLLVVLGEALGQDGETTTTTTTTTVVPDIYKVPENYKEILTERFKGDCSIDVNSAYSMYTHPFVDISKCLMCCNIQYFQTKEEILNQLSVAEKAGNKELHDFLYNKLRVRYVCHRSCEGMEMQRGIGAGNIYVRELEVPNAKPEFDHT